MSRFLDTNLFSIAMAAIYCPTATGTPLQPGTSSTTAVAGVVEPAAFEQAWARADVWLPAPRF